MHGVGHPWQLEYALGAATPGDGVYVRASNGLTDEQVADAVASAKRKALDLDRRLHAGRPALVLEGETVILVDDGLATGATMIAAARWARSAHAARVVAAVPVAAERSARLLQREVDEVVALHTPRRFVAVAAWYLRFPQIGDEDVLQLLEDAATPHGAALGGSRS